MLKKTTLPFHPSESSNRVFPAGVSGTIVDPQTTGSVAKKGTFAYSPISFIEVILKEIF